MQPPFRGFVLMGDDSLLDNVPLFFFGASLCPCNWELFLLFGRVSSFIRLISNQYIFGVFIMALMYMLVHLMQVHMSASSTGCKNLLKMS